MKSARASIQGDNVVLVAMSVETTVPAANLLAYAKVEGFDWVLAVATPELLRALVDECDRKLANLPATPHFLIHPDGSFSKLAAGAMSREELLRWIATPAAKCPTKANTSRLLDWAMPRF